MKAYPHTHHFEAQGNGVLVGDRVRYGVPLAVLGRLAHGLAVRAALASIFDDRFARVRELLDTPEADQ